MVIFVLFFCTFRFADYMDGAYLRMLKHQVFHSQEKIEKKLTVIKMDYVTRKYLKNKIFLLDTSNIFREISNVTEFLAEENSDLLLRNRAAVYFDISPEVLVNRILSRSRVTGKLHSSHRDLKNAKKPTPFIFDEIQREKDKIKIVKRLGIPVLNLDAEESPEVNSLRLQEFINKLRKER